MQGYYKQKAYIAAQVMMKNKHGQKLMYIYLYRCRPPTKLIGGFLEDGLRTETANNSDAYEMLQRKSKLKMPDIYHRFHKHFCVCLNRKSASVIGLKTRKSHSLLAMTLGSPSTSQAQFLFQILSSGK